MIADTPALTRRPAWQALAAHHRWLRDVHLRRLFADDPGRGERLSAPEAAAQFAARFRAWVDVFEEARGSSDGPGG